MGERVRATAGPGPEPAPEPAPALALSVVADGRSGAQAAGQLARLAGRLELTGVWWREPPLTGPPADDLPGMLDMLGSQAAPAAAGLIADARGLPAVPGISAGYRTARGFPIRLAVFGQGPLAEAGSAVIFVPVRPDRDLDAAVAAAAAVAAGRPVLVEVAVSVGRTSAEARARADGEELFAATGHPREQGLFGTLEECQAAAARLLHAGATELVCYLPRSQDLPDVLAQLRAISVGAGALRPGEPPSAAPPPPAGWGGRRPGPG
jgi:hypothetical protein